MNRKLKWLVYAFLILIILVMICVFTGSTYYHSLLLESAIKKNNLDKTVAIITKYPETINHLPTIMPRWWRVVCDYDHTVMYPLNHACSLGDIEIVRALLDHGADIREGLFIIVCEGFPESSADIAFLLIEYGADINEVDKWGDIAIKSCVILRKSTSKEKQEKLQELFDYLLDNCELSEANFTDVFVYCGAFGNLYAANKLLLGGYVDINCMDIYGRTALIHAASSSKNDMVIYLLSNGADKDIKDQYGKSAYDYALEYDHMETAELLRVD